MNWWVFCKKSNWGRAVQVGTFASFNWGPTRPHLKVCFKSRIFVKLHLIYTLLFSLPSN